MTNVKHTGRLTKKQREYRTVGVRIRKLLKRVRYDRLLLTILVTILIGCIISGITKTVNARETKPMPSRQDTSGFIPNASEGQKMSCETNLPKVLEPITRESPTENVCEDILVEITPEWAHLSEKAEYVTERLIYSARLGRYVQKTELYYLTLIALAEASKEPEKVKLAVAAVILNRVESDDFIPNNIFDVIFQSEIYTTKYWRLDGHLYSGDGNSIREITLASFAPNEVVEATNAVLRALAKEDPTHGSVHFYNPVEDGEAFDGTVPSDAVLLGNHYFFQ